MSKGAWSSASGPGTSSAVAVVAAVSIPKLV